MTQNASDVEIANQGFAAFRQDLNDVLEDITTLHSGTAAPSTTYANQWWYETDTDKLYIRNEDNDAWIEILTLDQANDHLATLGASITLDGTGNVSIDSGDFTVDTDTLHVDSTNNRVGIGTSTTVRALTVNETGTSAIAHFESDQTASKVYFHDANTSQTYSVAIGSVGDDMAFYAASGGNERMRIQSGGGISFNGDTAAANALDDYEEGTWTPVLKANNGTRTWTYSAQSGKYTKVGNTVTVWFNVQLSSNGSGTNGGAYVDGLPFTNGTGFSVYSVAFKQLIETGDVGLLVRISNTNAYFWLLDGSSSYPDVTYINTSVLTNDRRFRGQFTYQVA